MMELLANPKNLEDARLVHITAEPKTLTGPVFPPVKESNVALVNRVMPLEVFKKEWKLMGIIFGECGIWDGFFEYCLLYSY